MGRLVGLLVALVVLTSAIPIGAAEDEAALRLAQRVEDLYAHAETFKARFRQTFVQRASKKKTVSHGKLAAAGGGKLSFRYASPKGDRVVSDGEMVKLYEAGDETMYVMKLMRARHAFGVAFLLGELRLSKGFRLRLLDPQRKQVKRGSVLEAIPKQPNPLMARLILYVDPVTAQVLRVMVIDGQANTNRFDFDQRVFGADIPEREFRFTPPRGTKVVSP